MREKENFAVILPCKKALIGVVVSCSTRSFIHRFTKFTQNDIFFDNIFITILLAFWNLIILLPKWDDCGSLVLTFKLWLNVLLHTAHMFDVTVIALVLISAFLLNFVQIFLALKLEVFHGRQRRNHTTFSDHLLFKWIDIILWMKLWQLCSCLDRNKSIRDVWVRIRHTLDVVCLVI